MLQEIGIAAGKKSSPLDRWYSNEEFDLFIWGDAEGHIAGFQLCYDKQGNERALTWLSALGFFHNRIDSGEQLPTRNMTPVLLPDGKPAYEQLIASVGSAIGAVDPGISGFVMQKLKDSAERNA